VHVTTDESFAGEPVEADAPGMQSVLDASLVSWLGHLKAAAESRAWPQAKAQSLFDRLARGASDDASYLLVCDVCGAAIGLEAVSEVVGPLRRFVRRASQRLGARRPRLLPS
jgi:hypothetical protein